MGQGKLAKITASHAVTETLVRNRCSYQYVVMVLTNASTNEKRFYNAMVWVVFGGGKGCAKNTGFLCACFLRWDPQLKTR